jgi:potassium efflux system protein
VGVVKKTVLILLFVLIVAGLAGYVFFKLDFGVKEKIHIAFAGPLSGDEAIGGKSLIQAVQLYINRVNRAGGVNGTKIQLDLFDDQNNKELAQQKSLEIAQNSNAVAVIGHNWSSTSMMGGPNYKKFGIPAISATATSVDVTKDNPWFFRTVPNDNIQGKFLTHYIKHVLMHDNITIIQHKSIYGEYLAKIVSETARKIGLKVTNHFIVDTEKETANDEFADISSKIMANPDSGALFLAMYETKGADLVQILKDDQIQNDIVTPDAFASSGFINKFKSLPKEIVEPGYYTNGIYVSSPMIFDTANEKAQSFFHEYHKVFSEKPDWSAASGYDAAMLIVEAIKKTGATGTKGMLKNERTNIRKFLSGLIDPASGIKGVTGNNFFNTQGDAVKPMNIGVYQKNGNVSSLVQLQSVQNPKLIDEIPADDLIAFDQFLLRKTNVVYTGISVNKIDDMDFDALTFNMDFNFWFRCRPNVNPENIIFTNAVEPISIGSPIKSEEKNGLQYKLFRINGKFRADFLPSFDVKKHTLSVSFRHKTRSRENLIYVVDVLGMGMENQDKLLSNLKQNQVLNPIYDWGIDDLIAYQDIEKKDSLGDINVLYTKDGFIQFSRYNYKILIKKKQFNLFEFISLKFMLSLLAFFALCSCALFLFKKGYAGEKFNKSLWFGKAVTIFLIMVCLEKIVIDWMIGKYDHYYIQLVITAFEMLWWLIPAYILTNMVEFFIWHPVEKKIEQFIPGIIRKFINFIIYMVAICCIIAFVFDHRITSLLATSGVVAMIIGLAIQFNISNIFSGIALNLERTFRIGDWVKIGEFEGKVIDITWRTTRILKVGGSIECIPNAIASESVIRNYYYPQKQIEIYYTVHIPVKYAPGRVKKILMDALLSCDIILQNPGPAVALKAITELSSEYGLSITLEKFDDRWKARNAVWSSVWEHLNNAGIQTSRQSREIHMAEDNKQLVDIATTSSFINQLTIFSPFPPEARESLSKKIIPCCYAPEDRIARIGDNKESLFIVAEGVVGIYQNENIEVSRLAVGAFYGELLTGKPRSTDVKAISACMIFEITREDLLPFIEQQPDFLDNLSDLVYERMKVRVKPTSIETKKDNENNKKGISNIILGIFGLKKQAAES